MKILFVGNCNHYFNRKLVTELKKYNSELVIDFFSIEKPNVEFVFPYNNIFNFSIDRNKLNVLLRQRGIISWYSYRKWSASLKKTIIEGDYDYVHLQSLSLWHAGLEKLNRKIIITIWGSDFLRVPSYKIGRLKSLVRNCSAITFATEEISNLFAQKFLSKAKHKIIRFGLSVFNEIDKLRESWSCNNTDDKITITIGYNRHPAQQHLIILNEIKKIDFSIKEKLHLVLPLTYGPLDENYINKVKLKIEEVGCSYTIYEKFLSEEDIAKLCLQSNIMLQLQTTDAFSGSMQEYMYAGNIIITGKWLNYKVLRDQGVKFYEIEAFNELPELLTHVINNYPSEKVQVLNNRAILFDISSWKANITKWNNLYI